MKHTVFLILLGILFSACGHTSRLLPGTHDKGEKQSDGRVPSPAPSQNPPVCPSFGEPTVLATIAPRQIDEASGIAASRKNGGVFWLHNDGGDSRLFALNTSGTLLAIYRLAIEVEDWEDISLGPGPNGDSDYLYIGDTGSSGAPPVTVYRFAEPDVQNDQTLLETTLTALDRFDLFYPDDADYDAETLFVDPQNEDIYIVTKTRETTYLFRKPAPHRNGETTTLELAATLDLSDFPGDLRTTGGDITAAGDLIVIRTYSHAHLWPVDGDIPAALATPPCLMLELHAEEQGEAIAFTPEGNLVTTGEKINQPIYFYERQN